MKYLTVCLAILLLAIPARAAMFDNFESNGDTNGIDSSRWSTIDWNWNREFLTFGDASNVARSKGGGEAAMGILESIPIPLAGANALKLKHSGFHGGNGPASTWRNKFYAEPLDQNRIEIWGANANGITSAQPITTMVSQSDPKQPALVDLIDENYSHVVVRGVDVYCDDIDLFCNGGFGWLAIDDVETATIDDRLLAPNGNFEDLSKSHWDFNLANGAWGLGTGAGENRQSAYEGGRMAGSLLADTAGNADEVATGEISSVGWTVLGRTLKFQSQGFDGSFNNMNRDDQTVRNFVEIRDGGGSVLATIPGPDSDNWVENKVDLVSLGLNINDPFSVRVVDGADNFRVAWIGVDYFRFTNDSPPPPATRFTWNSTTGADWKTSANWSPGGGPALNRQHTAVFADAISSPHTVVTNTPVTVNRIEFDNDHMYAIGGTGSINLDSTTGSVLPSIAVVSGNHQFQAVVKLNADTQVDVASGSTLSLNNELNLMGQTLTKSGAGTLAINNQLTTGGGLVSITEGTLSGYGKIGGNLIANSGIISPGSHSSTGNLAAVPEPSTWLLFMAGLLAHLARRRQ